MQKLISNNEQTQDLLKSIDLMMITVSIRITQCQRL